MQKIKILIIGTGDLHNYGCEAIVHGTHHILKNVLNDYELYVASDNFEYDRRMLPPDVHLVSYKERFTFYRLWKGLLRRLFHIGHGSPVLMNKNIGKEFDMVLSCGGDNYCEMPDGSIFHLLTDLMAIGERAKEKHRKYVLWGASVGPFNPNNEKRVVSNLRKCDLITVREQLSYQYLENKLHQDVLKEVADPAFCMQPDYHVDYQKNDGCKNIGINLSLLSVYHCVPQAEAENFISSLFNALDDILYRHEDYRFVLIPHVVVEGLDAQNDITFLKRYMAATRHKARVTLIPSGIGARKTKGYVSKMNLLIAARMHCCVAGISTSTPTLFVTYSNKGKGMAGYAYGHHDYEIETKDLLSSKFEAFINTMLSAESSIRKHLGDQQERFKTDAMKAGKYLSAILKK